MAVLDPAYAPLNETAVELAFERAGFNGTLVAAIAYGALLMLCIQLFQVLITRPKRGRSFWIIVTYTGLIFPLATLAVSGMLKFTTISYVDNRNYHGGPVQFRKDFSLMTINVMGQVCTTLIPWLGDILMLYRLLVIWNYNWWIVVAPGIVYLARVAMSIPLFISETHINSPSWQDKASAFSLAFYVLCFSLNTFLTSAIAIKLYLMRGRAVKVFGPLQATLYTSPITTFVESGAFFTAWSCAYIITRSRNSSIQLVFLLPYSHVLAITRLLIVLRMAQNRAWSKDIISATTNGVMEWDVRSELSVSFAAGPDGRNPSQFSEKIASLPRKFQSDNGSSRTEINIT